MTRSCWCRRRMRERSDALLTALKPLLGAIDLKTMQQANLMVDRPDDKQSPAAGGAVVVGQEDRAS